MAAELKKPDHREVIFKNNNEQVDMDTINAESINQSPLKSTRLLTDYKKQSSRDDLDDLISDTNNPKLIILIEAEDIYNVKLGDYVTISPVIRGNVVILQWVDEFNNPIALENEMHLTLGPIEDKDFEKKYRLRARNHHNEWFGTRLAIISKETKPSTESTQVSFHSQTQLQLGKDSAKPQIIKQPQGGVYKSGSTIIIVCVVEKATSAQWFKDGNPLIGCNQNQLKIHQAFRNNTGTYFYRAQNYYGQCSSNSVYIQIN